MMKDLLVFITGIIVLCLLYGEKPPAINTLLKTGPVTWSFEAKKTGDKQYEIHLNATMVGRWHIYSQFTPRGGPFPTVISFNKNPLVIKQGTVKENGRLRQKHEDVFDVDVQYFDSNVDFIQVVQLKNNIKTTASGKVKYMTCNDQQCMPPEELSFTVSLN